ncbi:hypothetical protein ANO11243_004170 [Dothideomycetidae sp. 11243]|nr:hypothetical protein ANO11243_004170 [fungal sp. No.11243]
MDGIARRDGQKTYESLSGVDTEDQHRPGTTRSRARGDGDGDQPPSLGLIHRLKHDKSILVLVVSEQCIYAGTQGGEILVFCLDTYERVATIEGHRGSVLGLCLSDDESLLFSTAGDRLINVWDTKSYRRQYFLFSTYDVGDIFCVAFSTKLQTLYLGLQNTAIQWYNLGSKTSAAGPTLKDHPLWRENHPFYDSPGPGGIRTPRPADEEIRARDAKGGIALEIPQDNIQHFAHFGYVYCMLLTTNIFSGISGQEILITGGGDGIINIWKVTASDQGVPEKMFQLDDDREEGQSVLSMTMDGSFLYSGRSKGEVNVWDLETKQLVRSLKSHRDDVMSVCVGGGFLFSASVSGVVRKYDRQFQATQKTRAHEGKTLTSAFTLHKGKPMYVSGGNDNTIAVWNVSDCIAAPGTASKTTNEQMIESLKRFVSYRTVSSDSKYKGDCRRGASYLRSLFKSFGAVTEMLPTDDTNNPVIFARFRGNPATVCQRKKVLFYGHYDVVAAENESGKWNHDPFVMEGINGYLYGRGTSDNKGPIIAAIFACADLMSQQALDADIIFLIEGEEECGSRGFAKTIRQHKKLIGDIDWILLANSYWLDDRIPCLTYGLRGVIHATVQVDSDHPDLHSGVDGSAKLDEPLKDLVAVVSELAGKHGEVHLPGFYDQIPELTEEEGALYTDITEALISRNPSLGDREELAASLKRRWRDPSLTLHGFQTSGPDNATIIPHLARAALSIRLVPNQTADEVAQVLIEFLEEAFAKLGSNNRLTVTIDHRAEPWLGDVNNEIFQCLEKAIMDVWGPIADPTPHQLSIPPKSIPLDSGSSYFPGKSAPSPTTSNALAKPLYIREGGSIPAIRFLEMEFNAPAAHLPCGQASDSAHLDNERLRLINLYKSRDILSRVFRELPCR